MPEDLKGCPKDIYTASDDDWARAAERAKVIALGASQARVGIQDVQRAAKKLGLSVAMTYRLLGRYRDNPHTSALLTVRPGRKSGSRVLSKPVEEVIARSLKTYFLTPERPSIAALHRVIVAECRKATLTVPSYKAIRARVRSLDIKELAQKRFGAKAARDRFQHISGEGLRPKRPLQLIQIDHTLIDVIVSMK